MQILAVECVEAWRREGWVARSVDVHLSVPQGCMRRSRWELANDAAEGVNMDRKSLEPRVEGSSFPPDTFSTALLLPFSRLLQPVLARNRQQSLSPSKLPCATQHATCVLESRSCKPYRQSFERSRYSAQYPTLAAQQGKIHDRNVRTGNAWASVHAAHRVRTPSSSDQR